MNPHAYPNLHAGEYPGITGISSCQRSVSAPVAFDPDRHRHDPGRICRPSAAAALRVVAAIKPVQSLVAGVMGRNWRGRCPGQRRRLAPRTYALRPSDARLLAAADVVFLIGLEMETFLVRARMAAGDARANRHPG